MAADGDPSESASTAIFDALSAISAHESKSKSQLVQALSCLLKISRDYDAVEEISTSGGVNTLVLLFLKTKDVSIKIATLSLMANCANICSDWRDKVIVLSLNITFQLLPY